MNILHIFAYYDIKYIIRVIKHSHNKNSNLFKRHKSTIQFLALVQSASEIPLRTRPKQDGGERPVFERKTWIRSKYLIWNEKFPREFGLGSSEVSLA